MTKETVTPEEALALTIDFYKELQKDNENLKRLLGLAYRELSLIYSEDQKELMPDFAEEIRKIIG